MRADSCWSRASAGPGRRAGRRPCSGAPVTGTKSRPSRRSPSPPSASGSPSTPDSIRIRTSVLPKSSPSCGSCSSTSGGPWSSCGTAAIPIRGPWSRSSRTPIRACPPSASQAMRPNSTQTNSCGTTSSRRWPTVTRGICVTSRSSSTGRSRDCANPRGFCGPVFTHLTCRGHRPVFLYWLFRLFCGSFSGLFRAPGGMR